MTLSDNATARLWETFRAGGGAGLIREAVELVLQELFEAEAAEAIGAGRYERNDARSAEPNGHRPRLLATQAGDLELKIPKLRKGSFFPLVLEPRRRIDRALWAVVMEACVAGVSTRSVDDLVAALGAESGISKSEVSRICAGLDETVDSFRNRRLDHTEFPYVYLDATYLNVRNDLSQPASMAAVVATGLTADGNREVLGCDVGDSEGFWQQFLGSLRDRGLTGVRLVISDAHRGLAAAADRWFQGAARQRCRVHFIRILLAVVPKCLPAHGRRGVQNHLRPARRRSRQQRVGPSPRPTRRQLPKDRSAHGRRQSRRAGLRGVPPSALAEDLVHQPPRAHQQRDQTPITRRGHLPQPSLRHPPRRRHLGRPPRRMADHRPPLPVRRLHEPALPRTRYHHHRRTHNRQPTPRNNPKPTTPRDAAQGVDYHGDAAQIVRVVADRRLVDHPGAVFGPPVPLLGQHVPREPVLVGIGGHDLGKISRPQPADPLRRTGLGPSRENAYRQEFSS